MNDTEYAAFASEVLGRPVAANDQFSYDDLRLIRAAETEREIAEREERAAAEKAEAERQKKLEADPLFERRARAAQLREEREAHEQKKRDAIELVNAEHRDQLPGDASELDEAELFKLAYGEGADDFMALADDVDANARAALAPRGKTEAEITADMYRARDAREKAAFDALHNDTEGND
ncbi:MAG TPA: hypothetical protein VN960_05610 [Gaiellaceae bacterium]|nr:hypothetical protein [Gaiellaceae bacterium]